jgi:hypothetical protein
MSELGPHAGITSSRRDVWKEPVNLDQHNPTRRPADVCLNLRPTYVRPPAAPFTRAAIDVTITSPLPLLSTGGDPSIYTDSVTHHHQEAEQGKFRGRSVNTDRSYVQGSQVIRALNKSNTVLLPFTFDPLGGYGPTVAKVLFGSSPDPNHAPLTFQSDAAQTAYDNSRSKSAPSAILLRADKSWRDNSPQVPFSATYHGWFPSTWARQILGLNMNYAFADHIYNCLHAPQDARRSTETYEFPLTLGRFSRHRISKTTSSRPRRPPWRLAIVLLSPYITTSSS